MSFLDKNGLQTLTNKLTQGDAIKVASHRGHTVTNVIDNIKRECDNISTPNTMKIENNIPNFKIGQGVDLDVSGDVEEGKVEVGLKGKTLQNIFKGFRFNNANTQDGENKTITSNGEQYTPASTDMVHSVIKPNTEYTIIVNVIENTLVSGFYKLCGNERLGFSQNDVFIRGSDKTGIQRRKVISKSELPQNYGIDTYIIGGEIGEKLTISPLIILEGDHTKTPVEELPKYFENIKSSFEDGVVDFEVVGKNLIEKNSFETGNGLLDITNVIKTGETYSLSYKIDSMSSDTPYIRLRFQGRNKDGSTDYFGEVFAHEYIGKRVFPKPLKFNKQYEKIELLLQVFNHGATCSVSDVQLEMSTVATSYEPYYKKKISFNIGEPLRSLPNGVCDEIRNSNGQWELVRRVGKTILDETYDYKLWGNTPSEGYFVCHADSYLQGNDFTFSENLKNTICDKLPVSTKTGQFKNVSFYRTNPHITVLSSEANSVSEFKTWIAKNPITLYYELVTPITTPIEPMEFEVKPLATMTINSEIAPISNHKVVLNRAGQIEQGIVQIAELKSRVDALETAYDSYLLETQHKLSLLGFEYELESEEI